VVTKPAEAAFPGRNGLIAFSSNRSIVSGDPSAFDSEIFTAPLIGNLTQLTKNSNGDFSPTWSADGIKIVFVTSRDTNNEVYVMNADGSGQANLTNNAANDGDPAFSPNGKKIAFVSKRDGNDEIYPKPKVAAAATMMPFLGLVLWAVEQLGIKMPVYRRRCSDSPGRLGCLPRPGQAVTDTSSYRTCCYGTVALLLRCFSLCPK
jgi:dipeptidyl aminopeptidase/acylaminoacyl peptidase